MNKKVGIATIAMERTYNYGNKLQNFALQEFLREHGYQPETIRYEPGYLETAVERKESLVRKLTKQSVQQSVHDAIRIVKRSIFRRKLDAVRRNREEKIEAFEQCYINYTKEKYNSNSDLTKLGESYHRVITGSDQVWNPYYEGQEPIYYLGFVPKEKRIAYAPSVAVSEIPQKWKAQYRHWIMGIDRLSVREIDTQIMLKNEFALDAKVVCDPVFLLTQEQWKRLATTPGVRKPYFAVYILGKRTVQTDRLIRTYERGYQMKAVDVYSRDNVDAEFAGLEEFLGLVQHAEFVLTDSFHGSAFAIVFQRPMVIVKRDNDPNNSRVASILQILGIGERDARDIVFQKEKMPIDYSAVSPKLDAFVEMSKTFLLSALEDTPH